MKDEIEQEIIDSVHNVYLLDKSSVDSVDLYLYKFKNIKTFLESGKKDDKRVYRYRRILNHANERWRYKHCNSRIFNQHFHKKEGIYPMVVELHSQLGKMTHDKESYDKKASIKLLGKIEHSLNDFRQFLVKKAYK